MFFISNINQSLEIENSFFSENIVKSQLINALNFKSHSLINVQCLHTNYLQTNLIYLGGCFRSVNIIERNFSNVTISYCYSDITTVGIKIIDDGSNDISQTLVFFFFFNFKLIYFYFKIYLNECQFINNYVEFKMNINETGVALYLGSDAEAYLMNSVFTVKIKKNSAKIIIFLEQFNFSCSLNPVYCFNALYIINF